MTMKIIRLLNLIGSLFIVCSIFMIGLNSVQYTDSLKTKSMKDLVEYSHSDFYNKLNDNTIDELHVKLLYNIGMAQYQYRYTKRSGDLSLYFLMFGMFCFINAHLRGIKETADKKYESKNENNTLNE